MKHSSNHNGHTTHKHSIRKSPVSNPNSKIKNQKFPSTMPMGEFLFKTLHSAGVRHSFGIPGDFALSTFSWLDKSPIQSITMCHEPGAGFAAGAYSRLN